MPVFAWLGVLVHLLGIIYIVLLEIFSACSFSLGYIGAVLLPWKGSHHHRCPLYLASFQLCLLSSVCLLYFVLHFICLLQVPFKTSVVVVWCFIHTPTREGWESWLVERWMRYDPPLSPYHITRSTGWSSIRCYVDPLYDQMDATQFKNLSKIFPSTLCISYWDCSDAQTNSRVFQCCLTLPVSVFIIKPKVEPHLHFLLSIVWE